MKGEREEGREKRKEKEEVREEGEKGVGRESPLPKIFFPVFTWSAPCLSSGFLLVIPNVPAGWQTAPVTRTGASHLNNLSPNTILMS